MIKQLKVYGLEESFELPKQDYDDWSNEIVLELAKHNLPFMNNILISKNKLLRLSDLIDNKHEIIEAQKLNFKSEETRKYLASLLSLYRFSNELVEFSDLDASEDIVVISHIQNKNKDYLNLYILKKIMNVIMTDREVIEIIGKELSSFEYNRLASIVLSEDTLFNFDTLKNAQEEMKHALQHRFMSHKTMAFVNFLSNLTLQSKKEKDIVFMMDLLTLSSQVDHQ